MEGPVKLGDLFDTVEVEEGEVAVSLRITRIDRYEGVSVEFFEPPHIAKIFMTGTGAEAVTQYARLRG